MAPFVLKFKVSEQTHRGIGLWPAVFFVLCVGQCWLLPEHVLAVLRILALGRCLCHWAEGSAKTGALDPEGHACGLLFPTRFCLPIIIIFILFSQHISLSNAALWCALTTRYVCIMGARSLHSSSLPYDLLDCLWL